MNFQFQFFRPLNQEQNFPQFFIVQSEAGDNLALTDYQDGIVGATGYPFDDDATKFIDSAHNPNDGGSAGDDITITLNSAAVTHANNVIGSGKFKMAIINVHDFNDTYEADDDGFSSGLAAQGVTCLLYTSPSPRDRQKYRMAYYA